VKNEAPSRSDRKKFMFYDTEKRQTDFRIRLKHDNLNQSVFFRAMITGYLESDPDIVSFIERYKKESGIQSRDKRKHVSKKIEEGRRISGVYGLNADELENIFDIIEEDHPEI